TAYAGSVQSEFNTRAATTANSIDLMKNNFTALAIEVGNEVLPALNMGLQKGIQFIRSIRDGTGHLKSTFQAVTTWWTQFFTTLSAWGPTITQSFGNVGVAFTSLGETIGRIFALFSGTSEISGFGNMVGTVVAGAFNLLLIAVEGVAKGLDFLLTTTLGFWNNNSAAITGWGASIASGLSSAQALVSSTFSATFAVLRDYSNGVLSAYASWGPTIWASVQSAGTAFSKLGETISSILALFTGTSEISGFGNMVGTVVAGAFNLLLGAVEGVARGLDFLLTATLGFWNNNSTAIKGWGASIASGLSTTYDIVSSTLSAILGVVGQFWTAFTTTVGSWGATLWESLGGVGAAFSELGATITRIFALFSAGDKLGEGAASFGHIVGTVLAGGFNLLLIAVEGVVKAINFLLTGVEAFIQWVQGKEVDWASLIPPFPEFDATILKSGVDLIVGIVEGAWKIISGVYTAIITASGALGDGVGAAITLAVGAASSAMDAIAGSSGVERIFDQLDAVAERGYRSDFVQGQALTEALAVGEISLEAYRSTLAAVSAEGGEFSATAAEMVTMATQLKDFKMPDQPAPKLPPVQDIDLVLSKMSEIEIAAAKLPPVIKGAIDQVHVFLGGVSLHRHGVRMMETLAAGMKNGAHAVTDQIKATMQDVRNHLPSSPAKVGPLSDIHRLKFGETIASSIRAEPMVRAMRNAAAAAMAVAVPVAPAMAFANTAIPISAVQSHLPTAAEARSASTPSSIASAGGIGSSRAGTKTVNVTYGDIILPGAGPEEKETFAEMLREHKREIKELMDEEEDLDDRTEF
ncbi:MAG: phage tail tape measure protein, partial [Sulfitobacter sp.]